MHRTLSNSIILLVLAFFFDIHFTMMETYFERLCDNISNEKKSLSHIRYSNKSNVYISQLIASLRLKYTTILLIIKILPLPFEMSPKFSLQIKIFFHC